MEGKINLTNIDDDKISYSEISSLFNMNNATTKKVLNENGILGEKIGKHTLYNKSEIYYLKSIMEERYSFNKLNRLISSQAIELGLNQHELNKLTKFKIENIDSIFEYKSSLFFYSKTDVMDLLSEKMKKQESMDITQIIETLDINNHKQAHTVLQHFQIKEHKFKYFKGVFYNASEITKVKINMENQYKINIENYLTYPEILKMGCTRGDITYFEVKKHLQ